MTGKENIKIGDELLCISNEGLMSVGDKHIVKGITKTSINLVGAKTSWLSKDSFRWSNYKYIPKANS